MRYKSAFLSTAFLWFTLAVNVAFGTPLTEQQLLRMKGAGISQDVIIQQIQSNGIAFQADPDTLIALKKAGFSDTVSSALTKVKTGQVPVTAAQSTAPEKMPPAQAQVDPCVSWNQEEERLSKEVDEIALACGQVAKRRGGISNAVEFSWKEHCETMNCSVGRRLQNLPDPNHCQTTDVINLKGICPDGDDYTPDPNRVFSAVPPLESYDSKLTCAQLKVLTFELQENVAQMDKSIQVLTGQAQTHSQMAQAAGVIAPSATAAAAGMQMMSSSDSQKAVNVQQIRDSQQKRHDYLMQIYFQKQCDD